MVVLRSDFHHESEVLSVVSQQVLHAGERPIRVDVAEVVREPWSGDGLSVKHDSLNVLDVVVVFKSAHE